MAQAADRRHSHSHNHSPEHSPGHGQAHHPNPPPADPDPTVWLVDQVTGRSHAFSPAELAALPATVLNACFIQSTGHPSSGPFRFSGVRLLDLIRHAGSDTSMLQRVEVVSVDGFGVRLSRAELESDPRILLALTIEDRPLARDAGLVRLIVPSETTEALKQVKWVRTIELI